MAHDGKRYVIIVDDVDGEALFDSWCDLIKFNSIEEAEDYIEEHELDCVHPEWFRDF